MTKLFVAVAIALTAVRPAEAGPMVDLDFTDPPLVDLVRLFGDVGRKNIVLVDGTPAALGQVTAKRVAWEKVFADVVKRAGLASFKLGANTLIVDTPELVAAQKKLKRKYKGAKIDVDVVGADAAAAAKLVAVAGGKPFAFDAAPPRKASLRLKKVPADLAGDVLAMQTGGTIATANTTVEKAAEAGECAAKQSALTDLSLRGIATAGKKRYALFVDTAGAAYVVAAGGCVGVAARTLKDIGNGYVTIASREVTEPEVSFQLYPSRFVIP